MAVSKSDMMNLAMRYLGITNQTISDPDDPSDPFAVRFSDWWAMYIPKELEGYDWRFARSSTALNLADDTIESPFDDLTYAYIYPPGCLVPRYIPGNTVDENVPYEVGVQGTPQNMVRYIYTAKASAKLIHTVDMQYDYALFPYSFGVMIAGRFALEYGATKMGEGRQLAGLQKLYGALVVEAKQVDLNLSNEQAPTERFESDIMTARTGYTSGLSPIHYLSRT